MTEINNLLSVVEALQKEGVDFIIIGGIAVIIYGMPRVSEDIDIIIKMNEQNIRLIRSALSKLFEDNDIKEITFDELRNYAVLRYISPNNDIIDIISNLGETFKYSNIEYNIIDINGHQFKVATPKALIQMKSTTYREKDELDLLFLKQLIAKQNAT